MAFRALLYDISPMGNPALDLARLSRDEQFELLDQLWETLSRKALGGLRKLPHR